MDFQFAIIIIIIIGTIALTAVIAGLTGHHIYTMIIGVLGFAGVYIEAFWLTEDMNVARYILFAFFFLMFLFGRIKQYLEPRGSGEDDEVSE